MLWTSSVENSCSAPVLATAATQSLLSSTTSGALAPVSEALRVDRTGVDAPAHRQHREQDEQQDRHENLHDLSLPRLNLRSNMCFPRKISECRTIGRASRSSICGHFAPSPTRARSGP